MLLDLVIPGVLMSPLRRAGDLVYPLEVIEVRKNSPRVMKSPFVLLIIYRLQVRILLLVVFEVFTAFLR